jgi:transposase
MKKSSPHEKVGEQRSRRSIPKNDFIQVLQPNAAGIDIGSAEHWVAVPQGRDEPSVRSFGCFTADLYTRADWLTRCGVETVAMESTGVYWIPLFQVLEARGFEVKLVNARHVKNVPGRKTDVLDCQWLQRLHSCGLLSGSFRPEDQVCVLRSYWRHRENLVSGAAAQVQHMQKALTQMSLHLHKVITDITGETGMRIIRAILAGERDGVKLAQLKDHRVKSGVEQIAKALEGDFRSEHLFALKQAVELYDGYRDKIGACDREVERCLEQFDPRAEVAPNGAATARRKNSHQPDFDLHGHLYRIAGVDFTQIDGLDVLSVQTILAEVGLDPSPFPTAKHFCSWLGLCPNNRITGGRVKSSQTQKNANRAANAFRLGAQSLARSDTALGAFYRRMRARLGAPKAITATAHKLARIFYRMWNTGESYQDQGAHYYEEKYRERILANLRKKAQALGYDLNPKPVENNAAGAVLG